MTTIVTRAGKGSMLTHGEVDANFTNLNNDLVAAEAAIAAIPAAYQPLDSDLTAIAALSTTAYGRNLLTLADAAANKTTILAALGLTGLTVGVSSITFTAAGGSIELPIG